MMQKWIIVALTLGSVGAQNAQAVEISNVRPTRGMLGSVRQQTKFLPGDVLFMSFTIKGILAEEKSGKALFQVTMAIYDSRKQEVFKQKGPAQKMLLLGGDQIPTFAYALLDPDQEPGRYRMKISVTDLTAKTSKDAIFNFEVLPADFGIVQPGIPGSSFMGIDFPVTFSIVGMARNKEQLPDVEVSLQVLNQLGQKMLRKPITFNVMTLHDPTVSDLRKRKVIPISLPIFLNRSGQFTIEVMAKDNLTKETKTVRYPLRVLEP